MTTDDFIIELFCWVDDPMGAIAKHPQARLYPGEWITIGLLFALKGGYFRVFYCWVKPDDAALFAGLPERTRLQCWLRVHQGWSDQFLAPPAFFTVIDSYGIELIHPIREKGHPGSNREERQIELALDRGHEAMLIAQ